MASRKRWAALRYARLIAEVKRDTEVSTAIEETSNTTPTASITQTDIDIAIANLVSSAPETLNTLDELSNALGDDANFATTVTTSLGNKANTAMLSNYLQVANSASLGGSSDSLGTNPTKVGSILDHDYSTGNVFDTTISGSSNVIRLSNPEEFSTFKINLLGQDVLEGDYGLSSPTNDGSTTSFPTNVDSNSNSGHAAGLVFSPDGTKVFTGGPSNPGAFKGASANMYVLNTPWNLLDGYSSVTATWNTYPNSFGGITISPDGSIIYQSIIYPGQSSSQTFEFNLGANYTLGYNNGSGGGPFVTDCRAIWYRQANRNYSCSTTGILTRRHLSYSFSIPQSQDLKLVGGPSTGLEDMDFSPDGLHLVGVDGTTLYHWEMTSAFDINSLQSTPDTFTMPTTCHGVAYNENGTVIWVMSSTRTMYKVLPDISVSTPSFTFEDTVNGTAPTVANNTTAYLELYTSDTGNTYNIISPTEPAPPPPQPFTVWKSAPVTNATYGVQVAHGQTGTPDKVWVELTCVIAIQGYSVGDVITRDFHFEADETDFVFNCYANDTYVGYRQNRTEEIYRYAWGLNHSSGGSSGIGGGTGVDANWDVRLCAIWYNSDYVIQA